MAVRIQFKKLTDQKTPKFGDAFGGDRMQALAKLSPSAPPPAPPVEPPGAEPPKEEAAPAAGAAALAAPVSEPAPAEQAVPVKAAAAEEPGPELVPLPGAEEFQLPVAPASSLSGAVVDEPVSEALMKPSSKPALMRAGATIFKWGTLCAVLLAGGFYLMRGVLFPVVNELRKDKNAPAVVDKEASTLVQSVQQTKQVIAKNDANVAYLNQIMDHKPEDEKAKPAPVVEPPPVVAPPPPASTVPNASAKEREYARQREAIANYEVSGVRDGAAPRLFHEGQVVRYGDIIDRQLGLRFVGVNADERVVLFANADNEIFKKPY